MTIWFVARAAGLSALIVLTLTTALGAFGSDRSGTWAQRRIVGQYLHRVLAALGLGLLLLHISTIVADTYAHVGVRGALVPFTSDYRPGLVGLGTIAAYGVLLAAAVGVSRGAMANSARASALWRWVHGAAYACWALALVHGFTVGSDSAQEWVRLIYLGCLGLVVAAGAGRLARAVPVRETARARSSALGGVR
jgi:sulfoxide reductase heme-binding subunit YedZ